MAHRGVAIRWAASMMLLLVLGGCSVSNTRSQDPQSSYWSTEQELYELASAALTEQHFADARERFSTLLSRYPTTPHRREVLLGMAFAELQLGSPQRAEQLASRVIAEPAPGDYAYYLRASTRLASQTADPGGAWRAAKGDLDTLLQRYPNSRYREPALSLRHEIEARLAGLELQAARQHLKAQDYAGAVNRSRYLIETYPDSDEVAAALAIMATAYRQLGLDDLAATTANIRADAVASAASSSTNSPD